MKISTLIETLEAIRDEHGDLWVEYPSGRLLDATEITGRVMRMMERTTGGPCTVFQLDLRPTPKQREANYRGVARGNEDSSLSPFYRSLRPEVPQ